VKKYSVVFAVSLLFLSNLALAAQISAVKNNKVMLALEGESASPGAEFFAINPQGKKVAIIRISQVKGDRAVGEIVKGSAKQGYTLQAKSGGATAPTSSAGTEDSSYYDKKLSQKIHNGNSYGILGGYLMNTMSISYVDAIKTSMTGTGFGATGFYDYALSPTLVARGMVGLEQYIAKGSNTATAPATTDCTTNCNINLTYLSMYGTGRWNFMQGNYKSWIGGGIGYLYPMSKSSTAFPNSSQLQANQIFTVSAGTDIRLNNKTYVPVSVEYGIFPASPTVTASIIYFRAGYAWNL
jgi:hypothetical protein